jgi:hypothetical protein
MRTKTQQVDVFARRLAVREGDANAHKCRFPEIPFAAFWIFHPSTAFRQATRALSGSVVVLRAEQFNRVDTKRRGKPLHVVQRDVRCGSLNLAHVCPMKAALVSECLLRDFLFQTQPPEMLSQSPSKVRREVVTVIFGHGLEVGATPP